MVIHISGWLRGSEKEASFTSQSRGVTLAVMGNSCLRSWTETPGGLWKGKRQGTQVAIKEILVRYKEKKFFTMGEVKPRTGYPERLWDLHYWRYAKRSWTSPWATWPDFELVANFEVGAAVNGGRRQLNFRGHFQHKLCYHCTFLCVSWE